MSAPRAIRIPRAPAAASSAPPGAAPTAAVRAAARRDYELRQNQAANERARRLLVLYLGALVVLYGGFLLLDRDSPGGTSATAATGMIYFSVIAVVLAVGGIWLALGAVPRRFEIRPESVTVIEAFGRRRTFPPLAEIRPILLRRVGTSFLSSRPVETVEVTDEDGHRRTYQVEEGILPTPVNARK